MRVLVSYSSIVILPTVAVVMVAATLFSTSALADREASRQFFEEGTQHYNVGRFEQAAVSYEKAYEAEPIPALLFNIAQAHQQAGAFERALFFYEGYLRESPEAPNRSLVLERIAEARSALELQRAQAVQVAEAAKLEAEKERARLAAQARNDELKRAEQERAAAEARAREAQARAQESEAEAPLVEQAWFWPTIGFAGAAVAIISVTALVAGGTTATVIANRTRYTLPVVDQSSK